MMISDADEFIRIRESSRREEQEKATKNKSMMKIELTNFKVLSTGADGGHRYISGEVIHNGITRKITAMFEDKSDEAKLDSLQTIKLEGQLMDEGIQQSLLLLHSKIVH
jgi:hypothetical protein